MKTLLSALCLPALLAGPGVAAAPQARAVPDDQALQLARYLNSGDRITEVATAVISVMPQIMAESPEWQQITAKQPGQMRDTVLAVRPIVLQSITAALPSLWDRIGSVYRRNLTPAECAMLFASHSSPANVKLTRAMMQRLDWSQLINANGDLDQRAAATMAAQTYPAALATLTPGERAEIVRFRTAPLATKFAALRGQVGEARAEWLEEVAPTIESAVVRALPSVAERDR